MRRRGSGPSETSGDASARTGSVRRGTSASIANARSAPTKTPPTSAAWSECPEALTSPLSFCKGLRVEEKLLCLAVLLL